MREEKVRRLFAGTSEGSSSWLADVSQRLSVTEVLKYLRRLLYRTSRADLTSVRTISGFIQDISEWAPFSQAKD